MPLGRRTSYAEAELNRFDKKKEQIVCQFQIAWVGRCKENRHPYCDEHSQLACISCGEQATHTCEETGQFVCGAPLCDDCEHFTYPDGTNGGVGFNQQPLPDGFTKTHVRKCEQVNKPWYAQRSEPTGEVEP